MRKLRDKLFFEFDEEKRKNTELRTKSKFAAREATRAFAKRIKSRQTFTSPRKPNTQPRILPVASCYHFPAINSMPYIPHIHNTWSLPICNFDMQDPANSPDHGVGRGFGRRSGVEEKRRWAGKGEMIRLLL